MEKIFYLVSLGCPKNLVDSEVMAAKLLMDGWRITADAAQASLYLINTCAFLPSARREAEEAIRTAIRWKRRRIGRRIIVAGCLPERLRGSNAAEVYPQVDLFLRVDAIPQLPEILRSGFQPPAGGEPCFLADHTMPRLLLTVPSTAYLKIADGCNNRCAYCAIPLIRGGLRSRPAASVLTEARALIEGGVKELVVIAQDITAYGHDRRESGDNIADLLRGLAAIDGDLRIRLLYTHPAHYTEAFIETVATVKKIVPYLDIPLQHISDRILKAMGRHVTREETETLLDRLRDRIPGLVLRTTFIAGLPGETEAEFAELCDFVTRRRFDRCGVFTYAAEPGTPAAAMPDQVPNPVAEERAARLMELQKPIMEACNRAWIGRRDRVLIDRIEKGRAWGRGTPDAPDIDGGIEISGVKGLKCGRFCDIVVTDADAYSLSGRPVRKP